MTFDNTPDEFILRVIIFGWPIPEFKISIIAKFNVKKKKRTCLLKNKFNVKKFKIKSELVFLKDKIIAKSKFIFSKYDFSIKNFKVESNLFFLKDKISAKRTSVLK